MPTEEQDLTPADPADDAPPPLDQLEEISGALSRLEGLYGHFQGTASEGFALATKRHDELEVKVRDLAGVVLEHTEASEGFQAEGLPEIRRRIEKVEEFYGGLQKGLTLRIEKVEELYGGIHEGMALRLDRMARRVEGAESFNEARLNDAGAAIDRAVAVRLEAIEKSVAGRKVCDRAVVGRLEELERLTTIREGSSKYVLRRLFRLESLTLPDVPVPDPDPAYDPATEDAANLCIGHGVIDDNGTELYRYFVSSIERPLSPTSICLTRIYPDGRETHLRFDADPLGFSTDGPVQGDDPEPEEAARVVTRVGGAAWRVKFSCEIANELNDLHDAHVLEPVLAALLKLARLGTDYRLLIVPFDDAKFIMGLFERAEELDPAEAGGPLVAAAHALLHDLKRTVHAIEEEAAAP